MSKLRALLLHYCTTERTHPASTSERQCMAPDALVPLAAATALTYLAIHSGRSLGTAPLPLLPALAALDIRDSNASLLAQPHNMPALTHLALEQMATWLPVHLTVDFSSFTTLQSFSWPDSIDAVSLPLAHLSHLVLGDSGLSVADVGGAPLPSALRLRSLQLCLPPKAGARHCSIAACTGLTALSFWPTRRREDTRALLALTQLASLTIHGAEDIEPGELFPTVGRLSALRELVLFLSNAAFGHHPLQAIDLAQLPRGITRLEVGHRHSTAVTAFSTSADHLHMRTPPLYGLPLARLALLHPVWRTAPAALAPCAATLRSLELMLAQTDIAPLAACTGLTELQLFLRTDMPDAPVPLAAYTTLARMPALRRLLLGRFAPLNAAQAAALVPLSALESLVVLAMSADCPTPPTRYSGSECLQPLVSLTSLTELHLQCVWPIQVSDICALAALQDLCSFELQRSAVDAAACRAIAQLTTVRHVGLSSPSCGRPNSSTLAELAPMTQLLSLDLGGEVVPS